MTTARQWISRLQLRPHPEGGWFRETYRARDILRREALPQGFDGDRNVSTAIYYLLEGADFSALHRIRQDEAWHFYDGSSLTVHQITPQGVYTASRLGRGIDPAEEPQLVVPAGVWFAATVDDPGSFSLVGCTVAPGFDFADFEMPSREEFLQLYPDLRDRIELLTRPTRA